MLLLQLLLQLLLLLLLLMQLSLLLLFACCLMLSDVHRAASSIDNCRALCSELTTLRLMFLAPLHMLYSWYWIIFKGTSF